MAQKILTKTVHLKNTSQRRLAKPAVARHEVLSVLHHRETGLHTFCARPMLDFPLCLPPRLLSSCQALIETFQLPVKKAVKTKYRFGSLERLVSLDIRNASFIVAFTQIFKTPKGTYEAMATSQ